MQQKTSSISDFVNEIESRIKAVKDGASIVRYANNYDCNNDTPPVTVTTIESLTDEELAELVKTAHNIRLPRFLNDKDNLTQRFVFAAHLNSKPTVLSKELFNQFILDNSIPQNQIMARSVRDNIEMLLSADQIIDMFKYSDMNYIGGKFGGSVMGNGAYFEMNGGQETIYENLYHFRYKDRFVVLPDGKCGYQNFKIRDGQRIDTDIINICDYKQGKTMIAVYNPSTARVINYLTLIKKAKQFEKIILCL